MLAVIGPYFINFDRIDFVEQSTHGLSLSIGGAILNVDIAEPEYASFVEALHAYTKIGMKE